MRTYLLRAALALVTVGATGCVVVDADKIESHKPATIQSDECVVRQGVARGGASELHPDAAEREAMAVIWAE